MARAQPKQKSASTLADRIAVLEGGRVVETGRHSELLERRGAYASLYRLYEKLNPGAALVDRGA